MDLHAERSRAVADALTALGFRREFAAVIGSCVNTEYTCMRMLRYLRNASPADEVEVVDEMLIILEERDRYMQKAIERKGSL